MTSGWWQRVNWEQYGCCVYMPVLYSTVSSCELPLNRWSTGRECLRICVCVCVKERGGMGLRAERWMSNPSWRPTAVVRERWSVRSQHSLTTPDPSSGRESTEAAWLSTATRTASATRERTMCWPGGKKRKMREDLSEFYHLGDLGDQRYQREGSCAVWSLVAMEICYTSYLNWKWDAKGTIQPCENKEIVQKKNLK